MMMSSVAKVTFIKTKVIFRYCIKGVSNQVSSNSDHKIKSYSWKKRKSEKKFSGLQNGAIRGLQIGAVFRDYESGQEELQTGTALGISNWGKKISNRGRIFLSEQIFLFKH